MRIQCNSSPMGMPRSGMQKYKHICGECVLLQLPIHQGAGWHSNCHWSLAFYAMLLPSCTPLDKSMSRNEKVVMIQVWYLTCMKSSISLNNSKNVIITAQNKQNMNLPFCYEYVVVLNKRNGQVVALVTIVIIAKPVNPNFSTRKWKLQHPQVT